MLENYWLFSWTSFRNTFFSQFLIWYQINSSISYIHKFYNGNHKYFKITFKIFETNVLITNSISSDYSICFLKIWKTIYRNLLQRGEYGLSFLQTITNLFLTGYEGFDEIIRVATFDMSGQKAFFVERKIDGLESFFVLLELLKK